MTKRSISFSLSLLDMLNWQKRICVNIRREGKTVKKMKTANIEANSKGKLLTYLNRHEQCYRFSVELYFGKNP